MDGFPEVRLGLCLQSSPSFVSTLASVAEAIVAGELHSSIQIPPLVRAITKWNIPTLLKTVGKLYEEEFIPISICWDIFQIAQGQIDQFS